MQHFIMTYTCYQTKLRERTERFGKCVAMINNSSDKLLKKTLLNVLYSNQLCLYHNSSQQFHHSEKFHTDELSQISHSIFYI